MQFEAPETALNNPGAPTGLESRAAGGWLRQASADERIAGVGALVAAGEACASDFAQAEYDAEVLGKLLVVGDSHFVVLLNKHYGAHGDRRCAAAAFLAELADYERRRLGRSDVRLSPRYEAPEAGRFASTYSADDGAVRGYSVDYTNLQAQNAVYMLRHGSAPIEVNRFLAAGDAVNLHDMELFKREFDRRKAGLPYDVVLTRSEVEIEQRAEPQSPRTRPDGARAD